MLSLDTWLSGLSLNLYIYIYIITNSCSTFAQGEIKNNSKILSQVIFRKINEQNELKQSFSSDKSVNDKKQQQQQQQQKLNQKKKRTMNE